MLKAEFAHLHVHSCYSLLDGACRIDLLVDRAVQLGLAGLALTDHGVLYGAIDFYKAAREKGLHPIIGCEVYVAPASRFDKITRAGGKDVYNHLVILAEDNTGYQNLVKLVTKAHLEGFYYKPRVDKELLQEYRQGLIVLSGCLAGEIPEKILNGQYKQALETADWFRQVFGPDHFYLELQDHGMPEQAVVNHGLLRIARDLGLKVVATNDVHYILKEHFHAHDVLLCIGTQSKLSDPKRLRYPKEQFYLRSAQEMAALFGEIPEALKTTVEIAERCQVDFEFGRLRYPKFHPPDGKSESTYLRELLLEGLYVRYKIRAHLENGRFVVDSVDDPWLLPALAKQMDSARIQGKPDRVLWRRPSEREISSAVQEILSRLEHELDIIDRMHFTSYFLIVDDFVRFGRSRGISCVARGSAAGSLVTYLLQISNVDPLRYGLLFERFLNPERVNPPDIDIDFADDRRDEVINYVRQKYGQASVAQIITFGTMGARSVIRDVGRVMGLEYEKCDKLAKLVPDGNTSLSRALEISPQLRQAYEDDPVVKELIDTALVLEDLTRNCSVHAAGVVISDEPLDNIIPLKRDEDGTIVTQYAMGPVGDLGLLKMDFLGLKTLSVIRNTCQLIKHTRGIDLQVDDIPLDDQATYELLNNGDTLGVFQLESSGMRDLCRKFGVESLEHIIALIALYRPGPMDLIPEFIERRHGRAQIEYEHPLLEPILRETYGIFVYQEQVMEAARVLAGYTLGQADLLRRAMGKKKPEEMARQRETFVKGCWQTNRIPQEQAERIFDTLERFAQYGFNKSHAAAYALVAYHTAYLKAHYPVEFYCAMMTNDMADVDKLSEYINEARSKGIEVLPPDVNQSDVYFTPVKAELVGLPSAFGFHIRFGLAAIKGIGEGAVQEIINKRKERPFQSLQDLCERVDLRTVNRKVLEVLIRAGACDSLGATRATMFENLGTIMNHASRLSSDKRVGQASLFELLSQKDEHVTLQLPEIEEWPLSKRLADEKELLGFYVTSHPIEPYRWFIDQFVPHRIGQLPLLPHGSSVWVAGVVTAIELAVAKHSKKTYAQLTLEDPDGAIQVLCFDKMVEQLEKENLLHQVVVVGGELRANEESARLFAQIVCPIEEFASRYARYCFLKIPYSPPLDALRTIADLIKQSRGRCSLFLCFDSPTNIQLIAEAGPEFCFSPTLTLIHQIEQILGKGSCYLKLDLPVIGNNKDGPRTRQQPPNLKSKEVTI